MTPACRVWIERVTEHWAVRAAERRKAGSPVDLTIAGALESTVSELRSRLAAEPIVDPYIATLERDIASIAPRPGPYGLTFNTGPIMDAVRHRLMCRLAAARGEPLPVFARPIAAAPPSITPEALPFTAGPQLSLFAV